MGGLCPERGDTAVDATCRSLASGIPLPPGTWCGSVKDEDVCGQSFLTYPSEVDGYVDTTPYQYCIFDVGQKKCKKNTQWINGVKYDRVAFCDSSCLEGFQTKLTRLSTGAECNKGAGVWDRLNSESTCESTFYTSTDGGTDYKCKWYYDKDPGCSAAWPWKTCAAMLVRVQSAANSAEVISWMQAPLANSSGSVRQTRLAAPMFSP